MGFCENMYKTTFLTVDLAFLVFKVELYGWKLILDVTKLKWKWELRWLIMLSAGVGAGNNKPGEKLKPYR